VDTRSKILNPARAAHVARNLEAGGTALLVVTGYFDPLLAEHAQRLAELSRPGAALMVVVSSPSDPILPAGGRAEMVAALSVVDYVLLPEDGSQDEWLGSLDARQIVREEENDARRTRELIRHVHARQ
jgi:glycerol-3-phosphate cytidylyltransferase-like family protein